MSLPNYQHILKSAGSGNSVEETVEGAGRCLLSRTRWQDLDSDMTCPYYPHHLKFKGAQWHPVTIKGFRTWAQQVLRLEVSTRKLQDVHICRAPPGRRHGKRILPRRCYHSPCLQTARMEDIKQAILCDCFCKCVYVSMICECVRVCEWWDKNHPGHSSIM